MGQAKRRQPDKAKRIAEAIARNEQAAERRRLAEEAAEAALTPEERRAREQVRLRLAGMLALVGGLR